MLSRVRCPHCQEIVEVPAEQQETMIACTRCQRPLRAQPLAQDQIQRPDMRIDPAPAPLLRESIKEAASSLSTRQWEASSWEEFLARSPAYRREMNRLTQARLPDLTVFGVAEPLPDTVPYEAEELGTPLTCLQLPANHQRNDLIVGCLMAAVGLTALLAAVVRILQADLGNKDAGTLLLMCLAFSTPLPAGIWVIWRRQVVPGSSLWICPDGLIWQRAQTVGFCRWHQVERFSARATSEGLRIWISPQAGIEFAFSSQRRPAIAPSAEYIELNCAAVLLPMLLERICRGARVNFGQVSLDRDGVLWRRDLLYWPQVAGIFFSGDKVHLDDIRHSGRLWLEHRQVCFPMVVQAIVRIITEDGLPP
jgi:hypothetical protein